MIFYHWHSDILFVLLNNSAFILLLAITKHWGFFIMLSVTATEWFFFFLMVIRGVKFSILILLTLSYNGCLLLCCSCSVSRCPSAPLCPLSSSFLPWIATCFQQSLLVNLHLFSILLVNILNSDEIFASSRPRSTLLPWVQSQHCSCFPCPTSVVWLSSLCGAHGQSHSQKLLWWRACTKLLSFFLQH